MPEEIARYKIVADSAQARREVEKFRKSQEGLKESTDDVAVSQDKAAKSTDRSTDANRDYSKSASDVIRRLGEMSAAERSVEQSKLRLAAAQEKLTESQRRYDAVSKSSTASDRDRVQAMMGLHDAFNRVAVAQKNVDVETTRLSKDSDRLGKSMRGAGDDGNWFTRGLNGVGDAFRKARKSGLDFGAMLRTLKIPSVLFAVNFLISGIVNLAAALYALLPALGQVSSLVGALPGLFLGAAMSAGTLFAGLKGIGAGLKAYGEAQKSAGEDAKTAADQQRAAADAVESAERGVADAKYNALQAEEALTEARVEALYALQDLRIEAERAELSEKRAQLSLREARQRLREMQGPDSTATGTDIAQARLDVAEAELDLKDARHQNERTAEDLADAEKKGVAQSDIVVEARRRLEDATYAVAESEKALADAMSASSEAMGASSAAQTKWQEAMADMPPIATKFIKTLYGFRDSLLELRRVAQENMFPGFIAGLNAMKPVIPLITRSVGDMASVFGDFGQRLGELVGSRDFRSGLAKIFRTNTTFMGRMSNATILVIEGFKDLAVAARPIIAWLGRAAEKWALYFRNAMDAGEANGTLEAYFRQAIQTVQQLGAILADLVGILVDTGHAAKETGQSLWDSIEMTVDKWHDWTSSVGGQNVLKAWFQQSEPVMREFMGLLGDIVQMFVRTASNSQDTLVPLIQQVRSELLPALEAVLGSLDKGFGPALIRTITLVLDLFEELGSQGGGMTAFLKTLNVFAEIINWIIGEVPGADKILTAFFITAGGAKALNFLGHIFTAATSGIQLFITGIGKAAVALKLLTADALAEGGAMAVLSAAWTWFSGVVAAAGVTMQVALGWISLIAVAVVGAAVLIYKNWDKIGPVFWHIVDIIKAALLPAWESIKDAAIRMWDALGPILSQLWTAFQNFMDVLAQVYQAGKPVFDLLGKAGLMFILTPLIGLLKYTVFAFELLADALEFVSRNIKTFINFFIHMANAVIVGINAMIRSYNALPFHDDVPLIDHIDTLGDSMETTAEKTDSATAYQEAYNRALLGGASPAEAVKQANYAIADSADQATMRGDAFVQSLSGQRKGLEEFAKVSGKTYKEFVKEGRDAYEESQAAGDAWVKDQIAAAKEYRTELRDSFNGVEQSLDDLSSKQNLTADQIIKSFEDQLDTMNEYEKNWRKVSQRAGGRADDLLEHIKEMGLDGAGLLEALATANDKEFNQILRKWEDGKKGSKALGDMVGDSLTSSIDGLTRALKGLPNKIAIALGLDIEPAMTKLDKFYEHLIDKGMTLEGASRLAKQNREDSKSTRHTGGWAGDRSHRTSSSRRSNEVDARLLKDEFVVNPKAARRNAKLLEALNKGKSLSEEPLKYHLGGTVTGTAEPVTGAMRQYESFLKSLKSAGTLKPPKLKAGPKWSQAGLGNIPAKRGGYTDGMWALNYYAMKNFGRGLAGGPVPGHTYTGSTGYSQHAYGNARDYSGSASAMMRMYKGVVNAAMGGGPLSKILRTAIHHGTASSYGNRTIHDYTPPAGVSGDAEHMYHVHLDALPKYGGTPPGYPLPSSQWGYRRGGLVKNDGSRAHKDEFVVNRNATKAVGTNVLAAINRLGNPSMPATGSMNFIRGLANPSFGVSAMPNVLGVAGGQVRDGITHPAPQGGPTKEQVRLQVDIDGETLVRTMESHSRDIALRVGGRTRAGLNSGGMR